MDSAKHSKTVVEIFFCIFYCGGAVVFFLEIISLVFKKNKLSLTVGYFLRQIFILFIIEMIEEYFVCKYVVVIAKLIYVKGGRAVIAEIMALYHHMSVFVILP